MYSNSIKIEPCKALGLTELSILTRPKPENINVLSFSNYTSTLFANYGDKLDEIKLTKLGKKPTKVLALGCMQNRLSPARKLHFSCPRSAEQK